MQSVRGVLGEALAASPGGLAALAGKAAQQDSKALQVKLLAIVHLLDCMTPHDAVKLFTLRIA
jgi:hypothetical protein